MLRKLAVPVVAGIAVAACVPQDPFSPIAVELGQQGKAKILQTDCELQEVVSVEVIAINGDGNLDDKDTRIWRVGFKSPAKIRAFDVGVVPEGGEERVPWSEPKRDQALVARMQTASGMDLTEDFSLGELEGGKIRHHFKAMTREEFEKEAPCALK
ncbi:hypothetical protein GCM10022267_90700 [Lentzea roselyniae]|uniref:Lipoprotein n=1 Tax=Lentzea roselyniae TaxID=531940 RepID=A0ABP7CI43_9PSEU